MDIEGDTNRFARIFRDEVEKHHEYYDPDARLLAVEHSGESSLHVGTDSSVVHPTRSSLAYAVALLDLGDVEYRDRGLDVIDAVLELQSTDPGSEYYGNWPYYPEEPQAQMPHPDFNWAAFLGRELVSVLEDHSDSVPPVLLDRTEEALGHAARCIRDRTVRPGYTNISMMSTFVSLQAGDVLDDPDLLEYGRERLRRVVGYTLYHDGFTEYNSPTYTTVTLSEIGRMVRYFRDPSDLELARTLNDYAWRSLAEHYHAPTRQLAGPLSRCYEDHQGPFVPSLVHVGTDGERGLEDSEELTFRGEVPYANLAWPKLVIDCPETYGDGFLQPPEPVFIRDEFFRGYQGATGSGGAAREARTYLTSEYALGSFTMTNVPSTRRVAHVYWGTAPDPCYGRVRCLHDGEDFSSSMLAASQYANHLVGVASFVTDHGDTHVVDSIEDGTIEAEELTLRFEFDGTPDAIDVSQPDSDRFVVTGGDSSVRVDLRLLESAFGSTEVGVTTGRDGDLHAVEVSLYEGDPTSIRLPDLDQAAVAFGLGVLEGEESPIECEAAFEGDTVVAEMVGSQHPGRVEVPAAPTTFDEYFERSAIDPTFVEADENGMPG